MGYCTVEELKAIVPEDLLIRLSDDDNSGVEEDTIIQEAIDIASDTIDGYIGGRVNLPISGTTNVLSSLNIRLGLCRLYWRVYGGSVIPEKYKNDCDDAIRFLEQFQSGKGSLNLPIEDPPRNAAIYKQNAPCYDFTGYWC